MKRRVLMAMTALSGLILLGAPAARAQSEVDPDHFELSNVEPLDKAKADLRSDAGTIRDDGKVRLSYAAPNNAKSLRAGRHPVAVRPDEKITQSIPNRDGQAAEIGVAKKSARGRENEAMIVQIKGTTTSVFTIQAAKPNIVEERPR